MENSDYGDTDLRSVIEGDHDYNGEEKFDGYTKQRYYGRRSGRRRQESNDSDDDGYVDLDESLDSGDEE